VLDASDDTGRAAARNIDPGAAPGAAPEGAADAGLEGGDRPAGLPQRPRRVIVAVSGGSGTVYAEDLLATLRVRNVETHLIVTAGAKQVLAAEPGAGLPGLEALADVVHKDADLGAAIASGSYRADGMVIVPCSAGTLAKVAAGFTDNLVSRAAHVTLKERRPLVLVVREAPYSRPMLQNMLSAFDAGAVLLPASPGFYHQPRTIADLVGTVTARVLDHLGIENDRSSRWKDDGG
jgi:4-hydroxy-3-polyprenylbenzoate decarboxylase